MSDQAKKVLVITQNGGFQKEFEAALPKDNYEITPRVEATSDMNGQAARLAATHDVVLFDMDGCGEEAERIARDLDRSRGLGTILIALAGDDLPLAKARQLARSGVDDVLPINALNDEIVPQIEAWRIRNEANLPALWSGQASEGKVISIAQARGGVGASMMAVNLADLLQDRQGMMKKEARNEVAIVDLDFQFGTIASLLDVGESDAMWRMAMDDIVPDAAFVEQALTKSAGGLSVLSAPSRYGPLTSIKSEQIAAIIDVLKRNHDYVVLDLPRALVDWLEPALTKSNKMYMATDVTVPSVRAARKLIEFYLAENPGLDIEMVATQEKKPVVPRAHHKAACKLLERPFNHWIPSDPKTAREVLDRGQPVRAIAPRSAMSKAMRKMANTTKEELQPRQRLH